MKKILIIIFSFLFFNIKAYALIEIDITRGNLDPLPIAISPLYIEPGSKDIKQDERVVERIATVYNTLFKSGKQDDKIARYNAARTILNIYGNILYMGW